MAWAMVCIITVLPLLGGATISARWPLPMGAMTSITRPVMFSSPLKFSRSSFICSLGNSGVRFSNITLCLFASGAPLLTFSSLFSAK